ncbi:MAG: zinc-finger domain-containing protein [Pseudomonadota bacterium]
MDPASSSTPPPEIVIAESRRVSCNGGGGALGHPLVFYEMGDENYVDCLYCDRRFVLKGSPADPTRKT